MATEIEKLAVLIEANTKSYERAIARVEKKTGSAMRRSSKQVNRLSKSMNRASVAAKKLSGVFGLGGALSAVGLVSMGREAVKAADNIAKVAAKVGLSTDALQELRFAAERSGVATNALDLGMQRFSRRVGEAANGGGELYKILTANNIALRNADGSMRSQNAILADYADLIQRAGSDQERLLLAFKAFDSEGAAMVNMLESGSSGLADLRQKARDASAVIDGDLIKSAVKTNDRLQELSATLKGNVTSSLLSVADAAFHAGDAFDSLMKKAGNAEGWKNLLRLQSMITGKDYNDPKVLAEYGLLPVNSGKNKGAPVGKPKSTPSRVSNVKIPTGSSSSKSSATAQTILRDLERQIQLTDQHTLSIGKSEGAIARMNAKQDIWNKLQDSNIKLTDAQKKTLNSMLDGLEKSTDRFDAVNQKFEALQDVGLTVSGNLESAFMSWFETGKLGGKEMVSSILKDLARLTLQRNVLMPLFGGGSSGGSGLFGSLLSGLFNLPKFASGIDNVPRDMVAQIHKGEMVIPAAQASNIRQGKGGGLNLSVSIDARNSTPDSVAMLKRDLPNQIAETVHELFSRHPEYAGMF